MTPGPQLFTYHMLLTCQPKNDPARKNEARTGNTFSLRPRKGKSVMVLLKNLLRNKSIRVV